MEVRRSARVATEFFVQILGLESEPVRRTGNISTTGIYFATDTNVGEVGMMTWLLLTSLDGAKSVSVMAYVVRWLSLSDGGRQTSGAAFEFIPESDTAAVAIQEFVRYVLSLRREGAEPHIAPRLDATVGEGDAPRSATVREVTVHSMVLETSWPIVPGDNVLVDICAPGMSVRHRLEGRAVRSTELVRDQQPPRYSVELEMGREVERPLDSMAPPRSESFSPPSLPLAIQSMGDDELSRTVDDLLSALIAPAPAATRTRRTHLSGLLSRVPLTTLCSLFAMERMTGKLVVRPTGAAPGDEATVYVRDGDLIDVEPPSADATPRQRVTEVFATQQGAFEFYVQPVDRPDRIGISTTALLLDLARLSDEARQQAGDPPAEPIDPGHLPGGLVTMD